MGYNFAEGFPQEQSYEKKLLNPEFVLLESRLENYLTNLQTKFEAEHPEVIFLISSQIYGEFYVAQCLVLDKQIDELQNKLEELMLSPHANAPLIQKQRLEYLDQINFLVDIQDQFQIEIDKAEESRIIGTSFTDDKHQRAEILMEEVRMDLKKVFRPDAQLN